MALLRNRNQDTNKNGKGGKGGKVSFNIKKILIFPLGRKSRLRKKQESPIEQKRQGRIAGNLKITYNPSSQWEEYTDS